MNVLQIGREKGLNFCVFICFDELKSEALDNEKNKEKRKKTFNQYF